MNTKELETLDEALDYLNEVNLFKDKKKYSLNDIKKIKNAKPDEYSGEEELKRFVDKNYDKIEKISKELEEDPDKLTDANKSNMIVLILGMITSATFILLPVGIILNIISIVNSITIINRANEDSQSMREMNKVRDSLAKIRDKGNCKDPEVQKKIDKIINNIDDASAAYESRERKVK